MTYYMECEGYGIIEEFDELPTVQDAQDVATDFVRAQFAFNLLDEEGNEVPFCEIVPC